MHLSMIILVLCCTFCVTAGGEYTHEDVVNLHNNLFQNYTPLFRPVKDQSTQVQISFLMFFHTLKSYEVSTGDLTVLGGTFLMWRDEFLAWNQTKYNAIEIIHVPASSIWLPELLLLNSHVPNVIQENDFRVLSLTANGEIEYQSFGLFTTKCDTNVTKYPFDEHVCKFQYVSSSYTERYVLLKTISNLYMMDYTESEAWEIVNTSHSSGIRGSDNVFHSTVEFQITIRRRPSFLLIHVFVPLLLIGWLNAITCCIPADTGERVSFAAALFLSFSFVIGSASEDLPKNSVNVSTFSFCVTAVNILSVLGICWSVLVVRVSTLKHEVQIPNWLKQLLMPSVYLLRRKRNQCKRVNPCVEATLPMESDSRNSNHKPHSHKLITSIRGKNHSGNMPIQQAHRNTSGRFVSIEVAERKPLEDVPVSEMSWAIVARRLDACYFAFTVTALTCVTLSFFMTVSQ